MSKPLFIEPKVREQLKKIKEGFDGLISLKVIRTNKIVGDLGEYYASKLLNLSLVDTKNNKGFDAIDNEGKKYEIKTRLSPDNYTYRTLFGGFSNSDRFPFDFFICVNLNSYFEPISIIKFPYKTIMDNLDSRKRFSLKKDIIQSESVDVLYSSPELPEYMRKA